MAVVHGIIVRMECPNVNLEFDCVETVPQRLICCICMKVMKNPHVVICCGQNFCAYCIENWIDIRPKPTCPHCRATVDAGERPFRHVAEQGIKIEI